MNAGVLSMMEAGICWWWRNPGWWSENIEMISGWERDNGPKQFHMHLLTGCARLHVRARDNTADEWGYAMSALKFSLQDIPKGEVQSKYFNHSHKRKISGTSGMPNDCNIRWGTFNRYPPFEQFPMRYFNLVPSIWQFPTWYLQLVPWFPF